MIKQELLIEKYHWFADVYYTVTCRNAQEVASKMYQLGAQPREISKVWENMNCGNIDNGLTFSNITERHSLVVIGNSSDDTEFMNSLAHELHHLVSHICGAYDISMDSEEACYLTGETMGKMVSFLIENTGETKKGVTEALCHSEPIKIKL